MERLVMSNKRKHSATCHYCGKRIHGVIKTWDHIVPKSVGGPGYSWNLVTACKPCNAAKADQHYKYHCERCVFAWRVFEIGSVDVWLRPDILLDMGLFGIQPDRKSRRKRWKFEPWQYDPGN